MKRCFGLEFLQFYRSQKEKKLYYRNEYTNYVCILNYCKLSCPRREITWKVNHSLASLTANEKAASYQKERERDLQNLHCSWYFSNPLCLWAGDSMSITFLCQVKWPDKILNLTNTDKANCCSPNDPTGFFFHSQIVPCHLKYRKLIVAFIDISHA